MIWLFGEKFVSLWQIKQVNSMASYQIKTKFKGFRRQKDGEVYNYPVEFVTYAKNVLGEDAFKAALFACLIKWNYRSARFLKNGNVLEQAKKLRLAPGNFTAYRDRAIELGFVEDHGDFLLSKIKSEEKMIVMPIRRGTKTLNHHNHSFKDMELMHDACILGVDVLVRTDIENTKHISHSGACLNGFKVGHKYNHETLIGKAQRRVDGMFENLDYKDVIERDARIITGGKMRELLGCSDRRVAKVLDYGRKFMNLKVWERWEVLRTNGEESKNADLKEFLGKEGFTYSKKEKGFVRKLASIYMIGSFTENEARLHFKREETLFFESVYDSTYGRRHKAYDVRRVDFREKMKDQKFKENFYKKQRAEKKKSTDKFVDYSDI